MMSRITGPAGDKAAMAPMATKTPGEPAYKGKPHVEQVLAVLVLLHEEQDEQHKSEPEHSLVLVERGEIPHEAVYQADEACSYAGEERDFDEN